MKRLTKEIKRRRKIYKPTIGLVNPKTGKRVSVNAVQYYAWKRQQEELEAEKYARDFFMKFMREECPQLVEALNLFGNVGSYMY